MTIKIVTAQEFKTINWSGGTSTELLIYPPNSDYKQGNFDFRLSTATVEVEKSNFTSLPRTSRKLMILDGEIDITHENQYRKKLAKFDIDSFEGDWKTSSIGKCVDFNLMTRGNTKGELSAVSIKKDQQLKYPIENNLNWLIIYLHSGEIRISHTTECHTINKGSLLVFSEIDSHFLEIIASEESDLAISKVYLMRS